MKKTLLDHADWLVAGLASLIPTLVLDVSATVTAGDLIIVAPLYVIAWRMPCSAK